MISRTSIQQKVYNKFSSWPLFLGVSNDDMDEIIAHTKIEFVMCKNNYLIQSSGDKCDSLIMLTDGEMIAKTYSSTLGFSIEETLHAPWILEPENLTGLTPVYNSTYNASEKCNIVKIKKYDFFELMKQNEIVLYNFMNIISKTSQKNRQRLWAKKATDIFSKILQFIINHSLYPAGRKQINIHIKILAKEIDETIKMTSKALHKLEQQNLIVMKRSTIIVPEYQKLQSYISSLQ